MKHILRFLLVLFILLSFCSCAFIPQAVPTQNAYLHIKEIDHCVVEPDDKLYMTDDDNSHYRSLMDGMLNRKEYVELSNDQEKNEYYIDLLMQSPYFFFVDEYELFLNGVAFTYKYSEKEQSEMLSFIDTQLLNIVNANASKDDNNLDKILNVHGAVARKMTYDHEREDNKQLGSPLFKYPDDEIYKALKDEKSLCYGFAYTLRFALLQLDIDCFCVYGKCTYRNEGHMWNIFKYNGEFFTCDSAWDRSDDGYAQLSHFGKTDEERKVDSLKEREFSSTFFEQYGEIECTDTRFKDFRSINRYTFVNPHTYYMEDIKGNEFIYSTQTQTLE